MPIYFDSNYLYTRQCHCTLHAEPPQSLTLIGNIKTPSLVTGVANLDGRIYVSHQSNSILVFNGSSPKFDQIDVIVIDDLRIATDLAADTHRKLLYVSDMTRKIWKVNPNAPSMSASFFDTGNFMPAAISFCRRSSQLIVVAKGMRKLFVYGVDDDDGVRTTVVRLPNNLEPHHAVCAPNGNYLVAHTGLAMVDINKYHQGSDFYVNGANVRSYGGIFSGSMKGQLNSPRYLPVADDGSVMVADYGNGRVVRLSAELEYMDTVVQGVPVTHLSVVAAPQRHLLVGQKMNVAVYQLR